MQTIIESDELKIAEHLASDLVNYLDRISLASKTISIAISGGNTPKLLFGILSERYAKQIPWHNIHIFWCDERCVPPEHPESNYGMTKRFLLDKIDILPHNVHRIIGENDPKEESLRYSEEIIKHFSKNQKQPRFDWILLGVGEDGHTASVFPDDLNLFNTEKLCAVAKHPTSGQLRITMTGNLINQSQWITFFVTGSNKAGILSTIISKKENYNQLPAAHVIPAEGDLDFYLDKSAANKIEHG